MEACDAVRSRPANGFGRDRFRSREAPLLVDAGDAFALLAEIVQQRAALDRTLAFVPGSFVSRLPIRHLALLTTDCTHIVLTAA